MILLLPNSPLLFNYQQLYFLQLELDQPGITKSIKKIYWFPLEIVKESSFEKDGIEHIIVPPDLSQDDYLIEQLNLEQVNIYSTFLNDRMITILKKLKLINGYYLKSETLNYCKIIDTNLFFKIYSEITRVKTYFGYNERNDHQLVIKNNDFEKGLLPQLFKAQLNRFYSNKHIFVFYSEKVILKKISEHFERLTGLKPLTINTLGELSLTHKEKQRILTLIYEEWYLLTQNRKTEFLQVVESEFPKVEIIIYDGFTSNVGSEIITPLNSQIIKFPPFEELKEKFSLKEIFFALLNELTLKNQEEIGITLNDKVCDELINLFLSEFNSLTDLYGIITQIHPTTNSSFSLLEADYWYDLLFAHSKSLINYRNPVFVRKEDSSQPNIYKTQNNEVEKLPEHTLDGDPMGNDANKLEHSLPPNRIERKGKVVQIFFNNDPIVLENHTLHGLHYIYLIIKYADNSIPLEAIDLYQKLKSERNKGNFNIDSLPNDSQTDIELETDIRQQVIEQTNYRNSKDIDEEEMYEDGNDGIAENEFEIDFENGDYLHEDDNPIPDKKGKINNAISKDRYDASSKPKSIKYIKIELFRKNKRYDELVDEIKNLENLSKSATNPTQKGILQSDIRKKQAEFIKIDTSIIELETKINLMQSTSNRKYDTVVKSINDAINKIKISNEEVGIILEKSIHRKGNFFYKPPPELNQQFHIL